MAGTDELNEEESRSGRLCFITFLSLNGFTAAVELNIVQLYFDAVATV